MHGNSTSPKKEKEKSIIILYFQRKRRKKEMYKDRNIIQITFLILNILHIKYV